MAIGTVKWFNTKKGYGFIAPEGGDKDVFVHISALEKAGLHSLDEGKKVEYELAENKGKESAVNLSVVEQSISLLFISGYRGIATNSNTSEMLFLISRGNIKSNKYNKIKAQYLFTLLNILTKADNHFLDLHLE